MVLLLLHLFAKNKVDFTEIWALVDQLMVD